MTLSSIISSTYREAFNYSRAGHPALCCQAPNCSSDSPPHPLRSQRCCFPSLFLDNNPLCSIVRRWDRDNHSAEVRWRKLHAKPEARCGTMCFCSAVSGLHRLWCQARLKLVALPLWCGCVCLPFTQLDAQPPTIKPDKLETPQSWELSFALRKEVQGLS